jgi:hypothetical protein
MNTRLIMSLSAVLMGITGIILSFLPQETQRFFGQEPARMANAGLQVLGALYFAFAMTNWTARANLIGGIYGRPIAIGNLCHFTIAALALIKAYASGLSLVLIPAVIYVMFAAAFGIIFFTHPAGNAGKDSA